MPPVFRGRPARRTVTASRSRTAGTTPFRLLLEARCATLKPRLHEGCRLRILLDVRFQKGAGPNITSAYLARELLSRPRGHEFLILQHRDQTIEAPSHIRRFHIPTKSPGLEFLWIQLGLPRLLRRERVDVYHSLKHLGPLSGRTRTIIPVHAISQFLKGMQKLSLVDRFYWKVVGPMSWRRATRVIAVSAVCRDYLVERLGVAPERITVIHHGVHDRFRPIAPGQRPAGLLEGLGLAPPYLLCVGNPYPHKNYETAIRTLELLRRDGRHKRLRLAIVGSRSYAGGRLDALIDRLGLADAVIFTDFVRHEELVHVYCAAEALLFCSIYEGFAVPVVEALACGIPVVAADRGAVAEVTGGACVLIPDPSDHEAFARETGRILEDRDHRQRLVDSGLERAAAFRWDETARRVLEVYTSIADEMARS